MTNCPFLRNYSLYLAWLIALIATLGSLYFSEIKLIPVCHLCWYQRICMYPLVILLGIAAYREDRSIVLYTMPLVILGLLFSSYQYVEQMIPEFAPIGLCGSGPECSAIHMEWLGFITLPFLSMIANLGIILFLTCIPRGKARFPPPGVS